MISERLPFWAAVTAALHFFFLLYFAGYKPEIAAARQVERMCVESGRLQQKGRIAESEELLKEATSDRYRRSPAAAKAILALALHQLRFTGDVALATTNLQFVLAEFSEFVEAETAREYLAFIEKCGGSQVLQKYFAASGKKMMNKPGEALTEFDEIIVHWPMNPATPYALLQAYEIATHQLGDAEKARQYQSQLFMLWPSNDWTPLTRIK